MMNHIYTQHLFDVFALLTDGLNPIAIKGHFIETRQIVMSPALSQFLRASPVRCSKKVNASLAIRFECIP